MPKVLIKIASSSLGDTIGAMAVIDAFRLITDQEVDAICNLEAEHFEKSYPMISQIYPHVAKPIHDPHTNKWSLGSTVYDEYKEIFYKFEKPLMSGYAKQLGITDWKRPKIDKFVEERPIKAKYVCFSMHSTAQAKHWNFGGGWDQLCKMLRNAGLTPVCIDVHESFGSEGNWNQAPKSCVKKHGMNLKQMTNYIHHSEFFIGLSSGLSWVAHAIGKPVVMISGITSEDNEFSEDTIRLINKSVCHGCINDIKYMFNPGDWFWCPVNKGTPKQFECTTTITPEEVFSALTPLLPK
jgi:autotransporter strand-loop-strand O-heptosyltransferase